MLVDLSSSGPYLSLPPIRPAEESYLTRFPLTPLSASQELFVGKNGIARALASLLKQAYYPSSEKPETGLSLRSPVPVVEMSD